MHRVVRGQRLCERRALAVAKHRVPGRRIHQQQPDPQFLAEPADQLRPGPPGEHRRAQQLVHPGDPAELARLLPCVGVGHRADHRGERHAVGHGHHRQAPLAGPGEQLGSDRRTGHAQADAEPAGAGLGQPVHEPGLLRRLRPQPGPVGQQEFPGAQPRPGLGQVGRVHPGDLPAQAVLPGNQAHLQVRQQEQLADGYRHRPGPPAGLTCPVTGFTGPERVLIPQYEQLARFCALVR